MVWQEGPCHHLHPPNQMYPITSDIISSEKKRFKIQAKIKWCRRGTSPFVQFHNRPSQIATSFKSFSNFLVAFTFKLHTKYSKHIDFVCFNAPRSSCPRWMFQCDYWKACLVCHTLGNFWIPNSATRTTQFPLISGLVPFTVPTCILCWFPHLLAVLLAKAEACPLQKAQVNTTETGVGVYKKKDIR